MQTGAQAYVQTQFNTTGQGEVLILLYDGAIKFLIQAKEKIEQKDIAGKGTLISKALDIINELDSSLNMNAGGEISENLHNLYVLCSTRLLQANLKMDIKQIDSVIDVLSGLRSAYAEILNTPEAQAAANQIASKLSVAQQSSGAAVAIPKTQHPTGTSKAMAKSAYTQQNNNQSTTIVKNQTLTTPHPQQQQPELNESAKTLNTGPRQATSAYGKMSKSAS